MWNMKNTVPSIGFREKCPHDPKWKHFAVFRTHCHQLWEDLAAVVTLLVPVLMVLVSTGFQASPSSLPTRQAVTCRISENGMTIIQLDVVFRTFSTVHPEMMIPITPKKLGVGWWLVHFEVPEVPGRPEPDCRRCLLAQKPYEALRHAAKVIGMKGIKPTGHMKKLGVSLKKDEFLMRKPPFKAIPCFP